MRGRAGRHTLQLVIVIHPLSYLSRIRYDVDLVVLMIRAMPRTNRATR